MRITQKMKGFLLLFLMMISLGRLVAQTVDLPVDLVDFVVRFDVFIASLGGLAVASIWLTGMINGWLNIIKSGIKQIINLAYRND